MLVLLLLAFFFFITLFAFFFVLMEKRGRRGMKGVKEWRASPGFHIDGKTAGKKEYNRTAIAELYTKKTGSGTRGQKNGYFILHSCCQSLLTIRFCAPCSLFWAI
jgi:hypothetical protein